MFFGLKCQKWLRGVPWCLMLIFIKKGKFSLNLTIRLKDNIINHCFLKKNHRYAEK